VVQVLASELINSAASGVVAYPDQQTWPLNPFTKRDHQIRSPNAITKCDHGIGPPTRFTESVHQAGSWALTTGENRLSFFPDRVYRLVMVIKLLQLCLDGSRHVKAVREWHGFTFTD